jgi:biopolymer transport protein ExbB/TolQ
MSFWDLMFGGQQPVGMAVNFLIFVLFAVGCIDILRSFRKLSQERHLVKNASERLHAAIAENQTTIPSQSPDALREYLDVPEDSLLGHRIKRALQLRISGLGSRDVLQLVTSERVGSYGSLARQIGATLTLLGLLGTVFGLSLALLNIGNSSDIRGVEDLGRLSQALGGTMGGMKTAFGCTLAGLLTALVMSFMNYGLRRVQSHVLQAIEEFTACELLRALERVDPESDSATKAFANVLSEVSKDMVSLGEKLQSAAQNYFSGTAAVQGTLDKLSSTVEAFSATINQVAGNQMEFTQTMKSTRDAVEGVGVVVQHSSDLLLERLEVVRQNSDTTAKLQQSLLSHHEEFKKLAETVKSSNSDAVKAALAAHEAASKKIVDEILQKHTKELGTLLEQSQGSLKSILEQNRAVMTAVSDILLDERLNKNGMSKVMAAGGVN